MLRNVLVDARFRAYEHDAQSAALLDAVENVPDLLTRWSECNEAWVIGALQEYERRFNVSGERYSQILIGAPSENV